MSAIAYGYASRPKTIEVPLQHEQVLEVVCDDLPANPTELTDIFNQEKVPLTYYRALAIEYHEQQKMNECITVINAGLDIAGKSPTTQPREKLPLYTLLATLYLGLAKQANTDKKLKEDYLTLATQTLNEADRIHNHYEQSFIIKGHLFLLRNNTKEALRHFDMVLERRNNCVPALVAKANILFQAKNYKSALKIFQQTLMFTNNDSAAAETRLGIAQCYAHLGMIDEAKSAFKLCISKNDTTKAAALVLLSILEQNESKSTNGGPVQQLSLLTHGLQHMQQSHAVDRHNPVTLNLLSNYFFFMNDTDKALAAATRAKEHASNTSILAEAAYQEARTQHKLNNFDAAFLQYQQCLLSNPGHLLARFGLGQIYLQRGEHNLAQESFETVLQAEPECIEGMKILASIYALTDKKQQALGLFNKVLGRTKNDADLLVDLGQLHESKNLTQALTYYLQALELWKEQDANHEVLPELLNNIAALYHRQGDLTKAEEHYGLAIEACEKTTQSEPQQNGAVDRARDTKLTVTYNLGRLYEDQKEPAKAASIYSSIIKEYPTYADAHLRLGVIQQEQGKFTEAIEYYKQVFDVDENDAKAWIMIGGAQTESHDKSSKRSFEKVLKSCDKDDIYTHVALGNYHAGTAREMKSDKLATQREGAYKLAINFYSQALKRDPKNAYAANGLAIVLAENNQTDQARDIFNQVREATPNNPCVWVNLAHVSVELKLYSQAIVMYENALRKFYDFKDCNILLCLARAQFLLGKDEKKTDVMYNALTSTKLARDLQPNDKSIQYNIALVQQQYAQLVSDMPLETRSSSMMQDAIKGLDKSQELFDALIKVPETEHVYYDRKMAEQRRRFGDTLRTQMDRKILEQVQYEEQRESRMRDVKQRQEEREAQRRQEQEDKLRAEQEQRDLVEEERRRFMEKVQEDNRAMVQREMEIKDEEEERKMAKEKRKRHHDLDDGIVDDDEELGQAASDSERPEKIRKKKKLRRKSSLDGTAEQNDDDSDVRENADDDDLMSSRRNNKKFRSKAIIEDSEDDESE
ncbi:TPR-like protein [Hesseltinella vesiculosa]|uniref:TPR-like protein n=1 Tax=Hesseltinella vesiculosa TaxID=101127 RepID=A0A1X2GCD8_9FUNG|nr:TPR-like protein [Hesseltinella vesiculosa]